MFVSFNNIAEIRIFNKNHEKNKMELFYVLDLLGKLKLRAKRKLLLLLKWIR